jgi:RNA recognition motif-containing protein
MNIFAGSLPYQLQEADLKNLFEAYGEVSSVKLIIDRETGRSKGYGFIEMPDDEVAQKAISGLNGMQISGRAIAVSQAEERKSNDRRGGFSGGGNRGGGGFSRSNGGGGGFQRNNGGGGRGNRY